MKVSLHFGLYNPLNHLNNFNIDPDDFISWLRASYFVNINSSDQLPFIKPLLVNITKLEKSSIMLRASPTMSYMPYKYNKK